MIVSPRARPLLLVLALASGCAFRRNAGFAWQRLTGTGAVAECSSEGAARVCRWRPKGLEEDTDAALFFLHYATGDERSVARVGLLQAFYAAYRRAGRRPPRVFSVSYGAHWVVTTTPGRRQIVPRGELEALLARLAGSARRRYVWGMSMGGYNAAQLALSEPGAWTAAALSCPALFAENPFDVDPRGLTPKRRDGLALFTTRLASGAAWREESPNELARRPGPAPSFLIDANVDDEFGFMPGARALAEALRARGARVVERSRGGGHCNVGGRAAAEFLLSL